MRQSVFVSALEKEGDLHRWSATVEGVLAGHAAACVEELNLFVKALCTEEAEKGEEIAQALLHRAIAELGGGCQQMLLQYGKDGDRSMSLTGSASALQIEGVIFDMDGLIFDTERLYIESWPEVGRQMGFPVTEEVARETIGYSNKACEQIFQKHYGPGFTMDKAIPFIEDWLRDYVDKYGLPLQPGVRALLDLLREKGIPVAIGSSNLREVIDAFLESAGLEDYFDIRVGGDMVEYTKPAPDIFLLAAKELGLPPERCLVLEDSTVGVEAAWRAGCIPAMVPDQIRPDDIAYGRVWRTFSSLEQLPLALF